MKTWQPDLEFLDFLVDKLKAKIPNIFDEPLFRIPNGTKKGGEGYSPKKIIDEELRSGASQYWGEETYKAFFYAYGKEFEAYKQNKRKP